ncbi:uncharacterized protein LOC114746617 [Neltuma alba]|uniref:uncharacterized protein LOC114746617 n=1 Tax=Neltuma alba TaxID=207710 RepID=UPI0010A2F961|nr:uncharacterized protein LOC114746617 [Prosopis alba]
MSLLSEDSGQVNHPNLALVDTVCEVIGSRIYVIGGACVSCRMGHWECDYRGSAEIRCLDTRNPKDGWRTCFTLPFAGYIGLSAVVDDQWLYVFPAPHHRHPGDPCYYAFNVDTKEVREIPQPSNFRAAPCFSACLSPGTLVGYMMREGAFYQLDCKNSAWTVYQEDFPYDPELLTHCPIAVDDEIIYIYHARDMRLISYDIRNKKELHVVDLPKSFWFGRNDPVQLLVLSKNRFCLLWHRPGDGDGDIDNDNETCIYYSRFSVSYDLPNPTVFLEEKQRFPVAGFRVLNVLPVNPHADVANNSRVDVAGGEKPTGKQFDLEELNQKLLGASINQ